MNNIAELYDFETWGGRQLESCKTGGRNMTTPTEGKTEESTDRTSGERTGFGRRPMLKALGAGAALSVGSGAATAHGGGDDEDDDVDQDQVDQPEGFSAEVIVPHATFSDKVAAAFAVDFEEGGDEFGFVLDASTILAAKVTWEPEGTSGWHTHPGPVIVSVVEGEIEVVFAQECVTHTYAAGEAFVDTGGHAEIATNTSDTEQAVAYALFLGVPDGESPTTWVEPQDC